MGQKVWAFSLCKDLLGEISEPPTNKDLAFVTGPFFFYATMTLTTTLLRHLAHAQK